MKVQVFSKRSIKPSIPTPPHKRTLMLSLLDQIYPSLYMSCVNFYTTSASNDTATSSISSTLRKSLSKTLVDFYPFAGRVRDNSFIDCGDQGASFVEARADCELSDFLQKPGLDSLRQFVPVPLLNGSGHHHLDALAGDINDDHHDPVLLVQLTFFSFGGIAIGVSVLHKAGDGLSAFSFLKSWSSVTRGNKAVSPSYFIGASLLPPVEKPPIMNMGPNVNYPGWAARRFVFHISKLASLKAELTNKVGFKPTNVELVTAIIFRRIALASSETFQPATLDVALNLRSKMAPPLPENVVGNHVIGVPVSAEKRDDTELDVLVSNIRKALIDFSNEKASVFKGEGNVGMVCSIFKEKAERWKRGVRVYTISSICKFPFYETDFGWGKPAWVTFPMLIPMYILITDTKSDDGIEVWATLKEKVISTLEQDKELLAFASLNPSMMVSTCTASDKPPPYCRM